MPRQHRSPEVGEKSVGANQSLVINTKKLVTSAMAIVKVRLRRCEEGDRRDIVNDKSALYLCQCGQQDGQ